MLYLELELHARQGTICLRNGSPDELADKKTVGQTCCKIGMTEQT